MSLFSYIKGTKAVRVRWDDLPICGSILKFEKEGGLDEKLKHWMCVKNVNVEPEIIIENKINEITLDITYYNNKVYLKYEGNHNAISSRKRILNEKLSFLSMNGIEASLCSQDGLYTLSWNFPENVLTEYSMNSARKRIFSKLGIEHADRKGMIDLPLHSQLKITEDLFLGLARRYLIK